MAIAALVAVVETEGAEETSGEAVGAASDVLEVAEVSFSLPTVTTEFVVTAVVETASAARGTTVAVVVALATVATPPTLVGSL